MATGATCSPPNFDSYEQFCKIQPLQLNNSRSNTIAVPGEKLKIIGYTVFDNAFGNNIEHSEKKETWVSAKFGCDQNKLVKDFISQIIETIFFFSVLN